jgi:hypothetical protein
MLECLVLSDVVLESYHFRTSKHIIERFYAGIAPKTEGAIERGSKGQLYLMF